MPTTEIIYKMLLSCPSDLNKYYDLIKMELDEINKILSISYNSRIDIVHWSVDTYPSSGDSPQNIINNQMVNECDFLVSMFWTKFGTPTERYGSGTEEEIIEAINNKKQVFLYFSEEPVSPESINLQEYTKIKEFKNSISDKAYFNTFKSEDEFLSKLKIHIISYFDDLRKESTENIINNNLLIKLNCKGYPEDDFHYLEFQNLKEILKKKEGEIKKKLDEIAAVSVSSSLIQNIETHNDKRKTTLNESRLLNFTNQKSTTNEVEILLDDKIIIKEFADSVSYKINDNFFDLGDLKKISHSYLLTGEVRNEYIGNENAEKKYKLIFQVINNIIAYTEEKIYLNNLKSFKYLSLCLTNFGGNFETDIDIKLFFPKNNLISIDDIPLPGDNIINKYLKLPEILFKPKTSSKINEYPYYSRRPYLPPLANIYGNKIEGYREDYCRNINELIEYEIYREEEYDVLVVEYNEIKPNVALNFPSLIALKVNNTENLVINYTINTRNTSEVIKGQIVINKN